MTDPVTDPPSPSATAAAAGWLGAGNAALLGYAAVLAPDWRTEMTTYLGETLLTAVHLCGASMFLGVPAGWVGEAWARRVRRGAVWSDGTVKLAGGFLGGTVAALSIAVAAAIFAVSTG